MKDTFDWQEFLIFAKDIYNNCSTLQKIESKDEALCRTGISRAYYAVFHESENYLLEINPHYADDLNCVKGSHDKVILGFEKMSNAYRRNIGKDLGKFKEMRVRADYDERRYSKRGNAGSVVGELQKAIFYACKINKQISKCRELKTA